jgi:hypothetical protein
MLVLADLEQLGAKLDGQNLPPNVYTDLEIERIILTVLAAWLNRCEFVLSYLTGFSVTMYGFLLDHVPWDAERLADRLKNQRPKSYAQLEKSVDFTNRYFEPMELGDLDCPASIWDKYGCILVWHLPDVLSHDRVVGCL